MCECSSCVLLGLLLKKKQKKNTPYFWEMVNAPLWLLGLWYISPLSVSPILVRVKKGLTEGNEPSPAMKGVYVYVHGIAP